MTEIPGESHQKRQRDKEKLEAQVNLANLANLANIVNIANLASLVCLVNPANLVNLDSPTHDPTVALLRDLNDPPARPLTRVKGEGTR